MANFVSIQRMAWLKTRQSAVGMSVAKIANQHDSTPNPNPSPIATGEGRQSKKIGSVTLNGGEILGHKIPHKSLESPSLCFGEGLGWGSQAWGICNTSAICSTTPAVCWRTSPLVKRKTLKPRLCKNSVRSWSASCCSS